MKFKNIKAKLVDVFAKRKLTGNGLTIFWDYKDLSSKDMLLLTREMRQFESIFVEDIPQANNVSARIFTMEEELDFAGHPLIGLAAHLHEEYGTEKRHEWSIELKSRDVRLLSCSKGDHYSVSMELGAPEYICILTQTEQNEMLSMLNLNQDNAANMPFEVISTGLPYLIVPVISGLSQAQIKTKYFESLLSRYGAKFVYVLDVNTFEGRTWDNDGKVEDIATGSAAGPAAAFLYKTKCISKNTPIQISQGSMVGRPSIMKVNLDVKEHTIRNIIVSGDVYKVASICFS